jgi:hypothetical protein
MFPPELAQGLAGAGNKALSNIHISPSGAGLSWPDLDADFSIPSLMLGIFGSREWMRKLQSRKQLAVHKN